MIAALMLLIAATAEPPPSRAETCYAQVMILIENAMNETGRVAGPSWFVRDWWDERLTEAERDDARQTAVRLAQRRRSVSDPVGFESERSACVQEALDAGAVPGWN